MFKLTAELDRLRVLVSEAPLSSTRSQRIVLEAIARRVAAGGGSTKVTTGEIAAEVRLHQTYVAPILKTLEADGRLIASGRRARIYRLPTATTA